MCTNIEEFEIYIKKQEWVKLPEEDFNKRILESIHVEQVLWLEHPDGSKFYLYDFQEQPFICNVEEPDCWEHDEEEGEVERLRHFSITVDFGKLSFEDFITKICALLPEAQLTQPIRISPYYRENCWTQLLKEFPSHDEKTIVRRCGPFDIEKVSNVHYRLKIHKQWWASRQLKDLNDFLLSIPDSLETVYLRFLEFDFALKPIYDKKEGEGQLILAKIELSSNDHVGKTQEFNEKIMPILWEFPYSFKVCKQIEYMYYDEPELDSHRTEICAR